MSELKWQKSSYSSGNGNGDCLEVAAGSSSLHVRESDVPGVALDTGIAGLSGLLAWLKGDRDYGTSTP